MQDDHSIVRLEPKVMLVLVELANHSGQVLSKEELIQAVWPNVYVSEASLTRCISELRHALNDDPHSPRVIETINKQGYRLMVPVTFEAPAEQEEANPEQVAEAVAMVTEASETAAPAEVSAEPTVEKLRLARTWPLLVLGLLLAAIAGLIWAMHSRQSSINKGFRIVPFTSYPGRAQSPTFSPDGNQIAFIWDGGIKDGSPNLYIKLIGSEPALRITSTPAPKYSPAWSPDGKWIAFLSESSKGAGIFLVPVTGGEERQVYRLRGAVDSDSPGLSWSPASDKLVFSDDKTQDSSSAIYSLSLKTLEAIQLTRPDSSWDGDTSPAFSPDGRKVAFVRGADAATRNVYVMDADGGNVRQLTFHQRQKYGLTWMPDGKMIIYSSDEGGSPGLWQVSVQGGTPERLPFGTDNARDPAISVSGDRAAYSQGVSIWSILKLDLRNPSAPPVMLSSSMSQDSAPKWSPDDRLIAYQSVRSGTQEIWVSDKDGSRPMKVTSFDGPLTGSPSWSQDGRQIAFDSRIDEHSHIYVMDADGRNRRVLTSGSSNDIIPSWSHDGKWIYFGAKRSDRWEIWKVSPATKEVVQVTHNGGFVAAESADGQWVYYTKYAMPGLWRQPVSGGNEELAVTGPPVNYWGSWCITPDGIYYTDKDESGWSIRFLGRNKTTPVQVLRLPKQPPAFSCISVSHDGHWLLMSDETTSAINIQIVTGLKK